MDELRNVFLFVKPARSANSGKKLGSDFVLVGWTQSGDRDGSITR